jgi:hypothetical protein
MGYVVFYKYYLAGQQAYWKEEEFAAQAGGQ